jgi:hypothetical protein
MRRKTLHEAVNFVVQRRQATKKHTCTGSARRGFLFARPWREIDAGCMQIERPRRSQG